MAEKKRKPTGKIIAIKDTYLETLILDYFAKLTKDMMEGDGDVAVTDITDGLFDYICTWADYAGGTIS